MNQRNDLLAVSLLVFSSALFVWTGLGGAVLSETRENGLYKELSNWQSLIGVLGAFVIAYVAVRPVWRQVYETQRQAAAATIPSLTNKAHQLEQERTSIEELQRSLLSISRLVEAYDDDNNHHTYETFNVEFGNTIDRADEAAKQLRTLSERRTAFSPAIISAVEETISELAVLRKMLGTLGTAYYQQTSGLHYEDGEVDLDSDTLITVGSMTFLANVSWQKTSNALIHELNIEIPRVWQRVRELEVLALGGKL